MAKIDENSVGIVETQTVRIVDESKPLKLECGKSLAPIDVAYETYGTINEAGDNGFSLLVPEVREGPSWRAGNIQRASQDAKTLNQDCFGSNPG